MGGKLWFKPLGFHEDLETERIAPAALVKYMGPSELQKKQPTSPQDSMRAKKPVQQGRAKAPGTSAKRHRLKPSRVNPLDAARTRLNNAVEKRTREDGTGNNVGVARKTRKQPPPTVDPGTSMPGDRHAAVTPLPPPPPAPMRADPHVIATRPPSAAIPHGGSSNQQPSDVDVFQRIVTCCPPDKRNQFLVIFLDGIHRSNRN